MSAEKAAINTGVVTKFLKVHAAIAVLTFFVQISSFGKVCKTCCNRNFVQNSNLCHLKLPKFAQEIKNKIMANQTVS